MSEISAASEARCLVCGTTDNLIDVAINGTDKNTDKYVSITVTDDGRPLAICYDCFLNQFLGAGAKITSSDTESDDGGAEDGSM